LKPLVILKGKVITTDFVADLLDNYILSISDSGWTNNDRGLYWLENIFELETRNTKGDFRLLIMDGHDSHINVEMVNFCADHRIRLLCLPPHSTHILQPLDVGCFQPMKQYHSQAINSAIQYLDFEFSKLEFLHALDDIRKKTFNVKTIQSAFKKCRLVPFNPKIVLDAIPDEEPCGLAPTSTLVQTGTASTNTSPRTPTTIPEWTKAEDKARSLLRLVQFEGECWNYKFPGLFSLLRKPPWPRTARKASYSP
jgi:DDE superfamily endonuclease